MMRAPAGPESSEDGRGFASSEPERNATDPTGARWIGPTQTVKQT
jgi:hypothetical protein